MKTAVLKYSVLILAVLSFLVSNAQVNSSWFKVAQSGKNIWTIDDNGADNMYLVVGSKKALLIDTGTGAADLAGTVRKITDKPVFVVNTHGHPDHAGSNYQFEKIYLHKADLEAAKQFSSKKQRERMASAMLNGQQPKPQDQYQGKFHEPEYIPVSEGYIFDLGDRKIEVMETPGHTPGSICLLDKSNKLLFTGDTNNSLVWLFLDNCLPLSEYLKSLEKEASRMDEFKKLYPGHGPVVNSNFILDQISCVKSILDGSCDPQPYQSFAGDAKLCSYGKAQVAFNPDNL